MDFTNNGGDPLVGQMDSAAGDIGPGEVETSSLPTVTETGQSVLDHVNPGDVLHYFPDDPIVKAKPEHPARRFPKYIPTIDGGYWKAWRSPEMVELNTDSEVEEEELPPMSNLLKPKKNKMSDSDFLKIPIFWFASRGVAWFFFALNSISIVRIIFYMCRNYFYPKKYRVESDSDVY